MTKAIIQQLDRFVSALRPDLYTNLNPPLGDAEIAGLKERYTMKIPDAVKVLYQWKNGQKEGNFEALVNNSTCVPLEQALEFGLA